MASAIGSLANIINVLTQGKKADLSVIRAEVLFAGFVVEHNLPFAITDHAGKLVSKMFPDSVNSQKELLEFAEMPSFQSLNRW